MPENANCGRESEYKKTYKCQCCRRMDSDICAIGVRWNSDRVTARRVSYLNIVACSTGNAYFWYCRLKQTSNRKMWQHAWVAAVALILTNKEYDEIARDL